MSTEKDLVKKVAHLARIELDKEDVAKFAPQIKGILDYIKQLEQIDISSIEPTSHVLPLKNVFREDKLKGSLPVDKALQNAPSKEGSFFTVPRVIEGK